MEIVPIVNALSSLVIVLVFAFIVVSAVIDKLQRNKIVSMKTLAKQAHVDFCNEFGYNMNTPVSTQTARNILQCLSEGHSPSMGYLRSSDTVFNKDKINGCP